MLRTIPRVPLPAVALACVAALGALTAACGSGPLMSDVSVEPSEITPNQDGDSDVARVSYSIGAPASLRMTLEGADGTVHVLRESLPRSPGPHEALFGGVVDGRMLPDGEYTLRLVARAQEERLVKENSDWGSTEVVEEERTLVVSGGDTDPPRLEGLTVRPDEFTPNQDGIGDRVAVSYGLDEPTEVRLWLETAAGTYVTDILEEQESGEYSGEPGPHVYDYDAGVDADAPPPPDGDYVIVAEARDGSGNVSREELPLKIRSGGQPRAAIIGDVEWGETVLPLGSTLSFTATVRNVGGTPIRTRGPEPGHVYDNDQTFNSQAPLEWLLLARDGDQVARASVPYGNVGQPVQLVLGAEAGSAAAVPVSSSEPGADDAGDGATDDAVGDTGVGATDDAVDDIGDDMAADKAEDSADDDGAVGDTLDGSPSLCGAVERRDGSPVVGADVYVFESDGDNGRRATAGPDGAFCFHDLAPVPDHQRTYSRSPGAVRLGLEYDEKRTDIAYPFRWQLGASDEIDVCETGDAIYLCLLPGETVEISGGVRFVEPPFRRSTNAYLALMHEDVRRMHGPYNPERITIEY